jgi:hypothetical protein
MNAKRKGDGVRRFSQTCSLAGLLILGLLANCVDASQRMATCPTGTAPTTGSSGGGTKACSAGTRPAADGPIDDFEDGDSQLSKSSDRDGYWFTSHDPSGSTIEPNPLKMADEGAGGSQKALHVTGKTAGGEAWGVLLGANFLGTGLYDAAKFAGISFKAKVVGNSTKKVRFKVGDVNTHPNGGVCKSCWNHFGKDLTLGSDWAEYKVSFAEMKQEPGWGDRRPAVTPSQLVSFNWSIGPGQGFDLWIDDIQFFECM